MQHPGASGTQKVRKSDIGWIDRTPPPRHGNPAGLEAAPHAGHNEYLDNLGVAVGRAAPKAGLRHEGIRTWAEMLGRVELPVADATSEGGHLLNATRITKASVVIASLAALVVTVGLCSGPLAAQEEEGQNPLVEMVIGLLRDPDPQMRALGLQQVREGEDEALKGEAATRQFLAVLPDLEPDAQASLLEALGERGDPVARPDVLKMLESSKEDKVRASALKALGFLATAEDIALLGEKAAKGSPAEKEAARASLVRLQLEGANQAIVKTLKQAEPAVRVELLGALAARNARAEIPAVLECVEDDDSSVRIAALEALRILADEDLAGKLVEIVKSLDDPLEQRKAELALLSLCSRSGQGCLDAILAGLGDAKPAARIALLRAAARVSGPNALEAITAHLEDADQAVRDEAVRLLAIWPDPAALPKLKELAAQKDNRRYHVLALRGMVKLGSAAGEEKPGDVNILAEALQLAEGPEEKRLVLGGLGSLAEPKAAELAGGLLDDPVLSEEAALAVVRVAEQLEAAAAGPLRPLLEKVKSKSKNDEARQRAAKVLESL